MKSSPATTTFNREFMRMEAMNRYLIWVEDGVGKYVRADKVIDDGNTVSFIQEINNVDTVVVEYQLKDIKGYSIAP